MTNQELLQIYSAYLPYGIKVRSIKRFESEREMTINGNTSSEVNIEACVRLKYKMLLRPLSDLTKEIEHNGEKFIPIDYLEDIVDWSYGYERIEYWKIQKLFEWHFDVFGLIDQNLAINLNEVK